ncbi:MAG: Mur ligase family protein [Adlercreutzia equolifaciens]
MKHAPKFLGRVLILGLGKSGTAAAEYRLDVLGSRGRRWPWLPARRGEAALRPGPRAPRERGAVVLFRSRDHRGHLRSAVYREPRHFENSPLLSSAAAASAEVISEVEFAWRESDASSKWVAITGTNGKTTTTALTCHLLREAGANAAAVGNIGETCIDAVAAGNTDVYVAETPAISWPRRACFAPDGRGAQHHADHLSWHGSLEAYAAAKWKVLANLGASGGVAVLDACDDAVRAKIRELRARGGVPFRYIPIGGAAGLGADMRATCGADAAAFRGAGGQLVVAWDGHVSDLAFVDDPQIKGGHNQQNAPAAAACRARAGRHGHGGGRGPAHLPPPEHRIEPAGLVNGVALLQRLEGHQRGRHAGGAHRLSADAPHRAARRPRQGHRFGPARGGLRRERPGRGLLRRGARAVPSGFRGLGGLPGALRRHDGGGGWTRLSPSPRTGTWSCLAGLRLLRRV